MKSIGIGTIFGLSSDVVLIVFSTALAILLLWRDPHRRSTQYFALCMSVFALHGMARVVWQVAQHYNLDPEPLISLASTLYSLGILMLFAFVCVFVDMNRRTQRALLGPAAVAGGVYVILILTGQVYRDFEPVGDSGYMFTYSPLGTASTVSLMVMLAVTLVALYRQPHPYARTLMIPLGLLLVNAIIHPQSRILRAYPIHSLMVLGAVLLLGRTVLKVRVYQPLHVLNDQLAERIRELDQAMQVKAQFLANMSHELRTPLNSIIGYAELVVNRTYGELTPVQDDRLRKVVRNGHLLLRLIGDVLDLSRIEAGKLNLSFDRVKTNALLDRLLSDYDEQARAKGLTLMRSYGRLPAMWVDETRVRQILDNLLSNAVKFTEHGVIIVRGYYDLGRQQVVISVTDTGPGIPPEKQEHLFEVYAPAEGARQGDGTGLGLALASQLAAMHGGKLWFETSAGHGSTFHVALPAFDDSVNIVRPIQPRARSQGPVILAIDDDAEAIELLQDQLEGVGYRVYGAMTANDGLRLARELKPVLVALDLAMPDLDGWQILGALRGDPVTSAIPVLVISARDEDPAQHPRADGFLRKPVDPEMLLAHVRTLTGQPSAADRLRRMTPPTRRRTEEEHA